MDEEEEEEKEFHIASQKANKVVTDAPGKGHGKEKRRAGQWRACRWMQKGRVEGGWNVVLGRGGAGEGQQEGLGRLGSLPSKCMPQGL